MINDGEFLVDEGSFYIVSPGGALGLSPEDDEIDWMFFPFPYGGEILPDTLDL